MKIETYCPIFKGFYQCGYLPSEDDGLAEEIEHYTNDYKIDWEWLQENLWDYVDYKAEMLAVSQHIVSRVEDILKELLPAIKAVKYQKLVSPREYNFTNDAIDIEIKANESLFADLLNIINNNKPEFMGHIKSTYTSRDGFMSYYSNCGNVWIEDLKGFTPEYYHAHKIGQIIEFICKRYDYENLNEQEALYDQMEIHVSEFIDHDKLLEDYKEHQVELAGS